MAGPTLLSSVAPVLLPPTITEPIFAKATETSAIMQLARRVPLSVNAQTAVPVPMDLPVADWVGEAGVKPAAQVGVGVKTMTGKKLALIVPVSDEVLSTNPAGLYTQLVQDLPTAISRAFDYAAINGKSLRTGNTGPFTDFLSLATNTVALGTTSQANGGLYGDIVTGAGKVIDKNFDFTGIVADKRMKIDAQLATSTTGQSIFGDAVAPVNANINGNLAGYPTAYNNGVSGKYWRAGDSTVTVTVNGSPTGGTFTLSSGGNTTVQAYNAAAATIQSAIQAWGGIYANVTVSGSAGGPYTITYPAPAANIAAAAAPFGVNGKALTGGTNPSATAVAAGQGGTDSLIRGVGGDWSQAAYGVGMDITVKVSSEAAYFDGTTWHSAFQENLTLLLVEAYFGFIIGSPDAFVLYTKGSTAF